MTIPEFSAPMILDHPDLGRSSIAFDVGSHTGWLADQLNLKYGCTVHAFEPIKEFYDTMISRLQGRDKIHAVHAALMPHDGTGRFGVKGDMSGEFCGDANSEEEVRFVAVSKYLDEHNIRVIDLMALNCEGGEFGLLEYMIRTGLTKNIDRLIVQPHPVVINFDERWRKIRRRLLNTHDLIFQSEWVWEGYQIRPDFRKQREEAYQ